MAEPSAWHCEQVRELDGDWCGAAGDELVWGSALALDVLGERVEQLHSGLLAFPYLWRRFGPPWRGSDDHKELCRYLLSTPLPDVVLTVSPQGSYLKYGIGYVARAHYRETVNAPRQDWWQRHFQWWREQHPEHEGLADQPLVDAYYDETLGNEEHHVAAVAALGECPMPPEAKAWRAVNGPVHKVNAALEAALLDLLCPVFVRDVAINIFGRVADSDIVEPVVEPSRYAGYGMPRDALDALIREHEEGKADA